MLRRVTLSPFDNPIIDATIPFSVTLIMSQFGCYPSGEMIDYSVETSFLHLQTSAKFPLVALNKKESQWSNKAK
tara:strand:- start:67 stop:288 length:222 start_codon:yes stop_codon:yes gene_type:complete